MPEERTSPTEHAREMNRLRQRRFYRKNKPFILLSKRCYYLENRDEIKRRALGKNKTNVILENPGSAPVTSSQDGEGMGKRLTVEEAAEYLANLAGVPVSVSSVRSWKRAGFLTHYKFRNILLFDEGDLRAFFEAHRHTSGVSPLSDTAGELQA